MKGLILGAMMVLSWQVAEAAEPALDLLDAPVAYSANFTVSGPQGTYHGQVWHQPGRERRDFETNSGGQSVLLRRDDDSAYLMKPSGRWYIGVGLKAAGALAGGLDQLMVERRKVKEETIFGIRTTRYRVTASPAKGGSFDGEAWFSKDGILIKAQGTLTGNDGQPHPVETVLTELRVGQVDPAQLELPRGWLGMDLRKVPPEQLAQAVESMKPLLEGGRK